MIDIIETALTVNNNITLDKVPYHYLTRKETTSLIPLEQLNMKIQMNHYQQPFKSESIEDQLKLSYQVICKDHMKDLLENFQYVYVSMEHIDIKLQYKEFYYSNMYKQFHLIFKLVDWNDDYIEVESVCVDFNEFLKHQHIARNIEQQFNLKYNLKKYITCPCCFPTLASTALYYKEMNGKWPNKLSMIDDRFSKAFVLIKNDRINIENVCKIAQYKWKCESCDDYEKCVLKLGEKYKWNYDLIISFLHKTHYSILKGCENLRDKESNGAWKGNRTNSPSWRSSIKV